MEYLTFGSSLWMELDASEKRSVPGMKVRTDFEWIVLRTREFAPACLKGTVNGNPIPRAVEKAGRPSKLVRLRDCHQCIMPLGFAFGRLSIAIGARGMLDPDEGGDGGAAASCLSIASLFSAQSISCDRWPTNW